MIFMFTELYFLNFKSIVLLWNEILSQADVSIHFGDVHLMHKLMHIRPYCLWNIVVVQ